MYFYHDRCFRLLDGGMTDLNYVFGFKCVIEGLLFCFVQCVSGKIENIPVVYEIEICTFLALHRVATDFKTHSSHRITNRIIFQIRKKGLGGQI